MKIDEKKLNLMLSIAGSDSCRKLLDTINENKGVYWIDMLNSFSTREDERKKKYDSGKMAYYIKKLKALNVIAKDRKTGMYFLTRIGIHLIELIDDFKEQCVVYDISDLNANGKPKVTVKIVGRKLKRLKK